MLAHRIDRSMRRVRSIATGLEVRIGQERAQTSDLLERARQLVAEDRMDLARAVLNRREAALQRIGELEQQLTRVATEEELASMPDRLESQLLLTRVHKDAATVRYDAAKARADIAATLSGVSDDLSEVMIELRSADDRALDMEARADALDELVRTSFGLSYPAVPVESTNREVEVEETLQQISEDLKNP